LPPPPAVLQADKTTKFAFNLNCEISLASKTPSSDLSFAACPDGVKTKPG
jgi:hypothetical protein